VAVDIRDEENDIWIWDFAKETLRKLTYDAAFDLYPIWTLDSRRIIYASNRDGASSVYLQLADGSGTAERLTAGGRPHIPTSLARDGSSFAAHEDGPASFDIVLFTFGRSIGDRSPSRPLVNTAATEFNAEISPDGRYLAYQSNQSGRFEVYVRPFPEAEKGHWQVSTGGGTRPAWAKSGRELFYGRRSQHAGRTGRHVAGDIQLEQSSQTLRQPLYHLLR
jgi:Tol biopolymer transport system component